MREGSVQISGTAFAMTFAMSWCATQRYRAVSEHDWGETLSQITKTRAKVPALCAKAALEDLYEDALSRNLVHELSARTALVLF